MQTDRRNKLRRAKALRRAAKLKARRALDRALMAAWRADAPHPETGEPLTRGCMVDAGLLHTDASETPHWISRGCKPWAR